MTNLFEEGEIWLLPKIKSRSDEAFCSGGFQPADGDARCCQRRAVGTRYFDQYAPYLRHAITRLHN